MMKRNQAGDVLYLTFPSFEKIPFVYHAFSTRQGGVSSGIYSSMNLHFTRGDEESCVRQNYTLFCNAAGIDPDTLVISDQTHTANILEVTRADCGKGFSRPKPWANIDGLVTSDPGVTLVTHYADCVPIYYADPVKRVVALAHAGWKGTQLAIASGMIRMMQDRFSCDPGDIEAAIGPSIGPCCFEVGKDTADAFRVLPDSITKDCIRQRPAPMASMDPLLVKYDIDLQGINRNHLLAAGVIPDHIHTADICTKCNHEWLFSHRATNGQRGGMIAVIGMKGGVYPRKGNDG